METSVVIVNYNAVRFLPDCIDALLAQRYTDFEIIFVDNASSDGSVELLRSRYARECESRRIVILRNRTNNGFAKANNQGVRLAKGKYVALLNNDTKVHRAWLGELVRVLKDRPHVSVVGSLDNPSDPLIKRLLFKEAKSPAINVCGENVFAQRALRRPDGLVEMFYVSGNGMAFRKKEVPQPFDDDYFAYAEDTYLGWLERLKGREVAMNMGATMVHYGGSTKRQGGKVSEIAVFNGTKNQIVNYLLFYEWKNVIRVLPLFALTQGAHVVYDRRRLLTKLKAYWWTLSHVRAILRKRAAIQRQRQVPDRELLRLMSCRFYDEETVDGKAGKLGVRVLNGIFYGYCAATLIRTREFMPDAPREKPKRAGKR